jgi:aldehyde:ferredoxin oxidoreductase
LTARWVRGRSRQQRSMGGMDFACVLGQEIASYATGKVFFVSQALGFRHSHLDSGGYSFDQKHQEKDVGKAVGFLIQDEKDRVFLTSMVFCLFAREVYKRELLAECLDSLGYKTIAENMAAVSQHIQKLRWQTRLRTGFNPSVVEIPNRFSEVSTWKGKVDGIFMKSLKSKYAEGIMEMGKG